MRDQFIDYSLPIPISSRSATLRVTSKAPQKRLWWNWTPDQHAYPDFPNFVRMLRERYGVRVMTYINSFLTDVERGGKPAGSYNVNHFRHASQKGFLVKRRNANGALEDYLVSSGPDMVAGIIGATSKRTLFY